VRDAFASELFRLSPPRLRRLSLRGSANLRALSLSPAGSCPALEALQLGGCPSLAYLLVQSASLRTLDVGGCASLAKARARRAALGSARAGVAELTVLGCLVARPYEWSRLWCWACGPARAKRTRAPGRRRRQALVQCPALASLAAGGCGALEHVAVWSDALAQLDLTGALLGGGGAAGSHTAACSLPPLSGKRSRQRGAATKRRRR
jgi:hypothetical protein